MRQITPSSRTRAFARISLFDIVWTGLSPFLAYLVRDGSIIRADSTVIYCGIATVTSLIAFQWFKISAPISSFFSVRDAFKLTQSCIFAVALTAVVLFTFTRLDDAPRSIPLIHFFVLTGGLVGQRFILRVVVTHLDERRSNSNTDTLQNILVIEASRLAWFYSRMVDEFAVDQSRIIGVLDDRISLHNRSLNGHSIVGSPKHISKIIDEYSIHGIEVHKVVVATQRDKLTGSVWDEIRKTCEAKHIRIEWLADQFTAALSLNFDRTIKPDDNLAPISSEFYWKARLCLDAAFAVVTLIVLAPLALLVATLVLIDVGIPIVFWQQRVGYLGGALHVYKFRTMRASFDNEGNAISESQRLSWIGQALRKTRLDEIPQLFNIILGNMSLVGPRPLLPIDQPKSGKIRLQVRPGLTGWAQVNGGKLLSPEEKDALDEWYIVRASFLFDMRILFRTITMIIRGDQRNELEISEAMNERSTKLNLTMPVEPGEAGVSKHGTDLPSPQCKSHASKK